MNTRAPTLKDLATSILGLLEEHGDLPVHVGNCSSGVMISVHPRLPNITAGARIDIYCHPKSGIETKVW